MAKAKSSGRKQNSTGKQPQRKTAGKAVRDPAKKKAISAKAGKSNKAKGPAGKKPATAKGSPTVAKPKTPRKASKPMAKGAAGKGTTKGKAQAKRSVTPAAAGRKPGGLQKAPVAAGGAKRGPAKVTKPKLKEPVRDTAPEAASAGVAAAPAVADAGVATSLPVSQETVPPPQGSGTASEESPASGPDGGAEGATDAVGGKEGTEPTGG